MNFQNIQRSKCDLQTHTFYSDGKHSPKEVIDLAVDANLLALSMTDHLTINAYKEAIPYANEKGICLIPGIEFPAAIYGHKVDILGLGIDLQLTEELLPQFIAKWRENNMLFIQKTLQKFHNLGYQVDSDESKIDLGNPNWLITTQLESSDYNKKLFHERFWQESNGSLWFHTYMESGQPCSTVGFENFYQMHLEMIHNAKGLAIVAHPRRKEYYASDKDILALQTAGIDGVEVYYPKHSEEDTQQLLKLAQKHHLVISGGSDFHRLERGDKVGKATINVGKLPDKLKSLINI